MKRSRSKLFAALVAAPLTVGSVGLLTAATPSTTTPVKTTVATNAPAKTMHSSSPQVLAPESLDVANALSDAFRNVASHVLPAVVAIENRPDDSWQATANKPRRGQAPGANPFKGTPFEGMPLDQMFPNGVPQQSPRSQGGIGSGVIIDSAGIVLTNNHVVAGGGKVIIKTHDGREFEATEVLTDPQTDIAVVRFQGDSSLVAAKIGDSDSMEVGDWVVALGQPFGLEGTVTTGIVSAKNRGIGITDRENFIQTDAAINPGNSGGPLVNLKGEIIGINTAISSRGGGNNGVGFAVPSNLASWVSGQLVSSGHVNRSYLGVSIQPVNYELASQLGVAPKSGVAINQVFPETPAAKAGFKTGDVIVRFGGQSVTTPQQLQLAVERSKSGTELTVDVIRDGKSIQLSYVGESAPDTFAAKTSSKPVEGVKMKSLGVEIRSLTADVAKQLDMEDQVGVVITSVQDESPAAEAGLEPGMVIAQVNRENVATAEDFEKALAADTDGSVLLLVRSDAGSRFVVVAK
ncbi:Periplasmic serine endoprotease DegP precursor [Rubripirellula lacrimiformis]|uniref:Periplasmic serine endoprotease DegP n=1 Tax=Rubripirellula lacrimiformis TaxID=1930273 RepID=A0A517NFJ0_9BACT|nr:Do family serine endopeptidase [Rubripirellula lacrimiformis]QDT05902.1 Periplasmic serine endoprotease DegP precursor [Rubripirellula lacrimiformis]